MSVLDVCFTDEQIVPADGGTLIFSGDVCHPSNVVLEIKLPALPSVGARWVPYIGFTLLSRVSNKSGHFLFDMVDLILNHELKTPDCDRLNAMIDADIRSTVASVIYVPFPIKLKDYVITMAPLSSLVIMDNGVPIPSVTIKCRVCYVM